jgi:ComF family protein
MCFRRSLASLVALVRSAVGLPGAGSGALASLVARVRSVAGAPGAGSLSVAGAGRVVVGLLLAIVRRVVAPSRCAACDAAVSAGSLAEVVTFCAACARSIERPAPGGAGADDVAFAVYGGAVAEAVRRFKYGPRPDLALPLGELIRRAAREAGLRADLVVPVPLHPARLRERGFNQAALLAAAVASEIGAPLAARALVRARATRAQASLDRAERLTNLAGAIRARSPWSLRGRHVLLVDDVRTTGSTLGACRAAALAAGAARVTTLVLATREPARSGSLTDPG